MLRHDLDAWLVFLILKFGLECIGISPRTCFRGRTFAIDGPLGGGARLFFVFYFMSTALHGCT